MDLAQLARNYCLAHNWPLWLLPALEQVLTDFERRLRAEGPPPSPLPPPSDHPSAPVTAPI